MVVPDAAVIREWSKVDFNRLGFGDDEQLQVIVDRASAFISWAAGFKFADVPVDDPLKTLIEQATQYKTEALAYQESPDLVETLADFMVISSFSAGNYSESRRSLTELKNAGMIDSDPRVNSILWTILSPDMRDQWLAWINGTNAPAFSVTEVAWTEDGIWSPYDPWHMNADPPWIPGGPS